MIKKVMGFLIGAAITYVTAVFWVSQFNIAEITALGYSVSFGDRLTTTLHDLGNMISVYFTLIAIALIIAWLFTGLLLSRFIPPSATLYALAGFTGLVAMHVLLKATLGITGVAPTRTLMGLLSQGICGALGGWFFYHIAYRPTADKVATES